MSTRLQKKLAEKIANEDPANKPDNIGALLEMVGYSPTTAKARPGAILKQKGVVDELKVLGFSEQEADSVVAQILHDKKAKASDRLGAADRVYKRLGSYRPGKPRNVRIEIDPESKRKARLALQALFNND